MPGSITTRKALLYLCMERGFLSLSVAFSDFG